MRQEAEDAEGIADTDDHHLIADVGEDDVVGTARAIAPAVDPDEDGQLALHRRRRTVEREAVFLSDEKVGIVPALIVLDAGRGLGGCLTNASPRDHRLRRLPAEIVAGRRGDRKAAEKKAPVPPGPAD